MIIAVDFDGILCENKFPEIGRPHYHMISTIRQILDAGHEVILWTSRADHRLQDAVDWCNDYGLHFSAINENAPSNIKEHITEHPNGTRKVYADIYVDDHDVTVVRDMKHTQWDSIVNSLADKLKRLVLKND